MARTSHRDPLEDRNGVNFRGSGHLPGSCIASFGYIVFKGPIGPMKVGGNYARVFMVSTSHSHAGKMAPRQMFSAPIAAPNAAAKSLI